MYLCPWRRFLLEKDVLICLGFHLKKYPHMCVSVWTRACFRSCPGAGVTLELFQLLMHYRQIGLQIGLFAVDWHHAEMTSPLEWRGPPLTLWPLLKQQLQYNSFMSWIRLQPFECRSTALPLEKWMSPAPHRGASCTPPIKTIPSNARWIC